MTVDSPPLSVSELLADSNNLAVVYRHVSLCIKYLFFFFSSLLFLLLLSHSFTVSLVEMLVSDAAGISEGPTDMWAQRIWQLPGQAALGLS